MDEDKEAEPVVYTLTQLFGQLTVLSKAKQQAQEAKPLIQCSFAVDTSLLEKVKQDIKQIYEVEFTEVTPPAGEQKPVAKIFDRVSIVSREVESLTKPVFSQGVTNTSNLQYCELEDGDRIYYFDLSNHYYYDVSTGIWHATTKSTVLPHHSGITCHKY
eukprot:gene2456-2792_t